MIKRLQLDFYKAVGVVCKRRRVAEGYTIAQLAREAGEQIKTIQCIESGKCHSMHHLVWMNDILSIDTSDIIEVLGEENLHEQEEIKGINHLI